MCNDANEWSVVSGQGGSLILKMDHLACFVGGMFVLGAKHSDDPEAHLKVV